MSGQMKGRGCPDAEALAVFAEGRSGFLARRRMSWHVAGCEECLMVVADLIRFEEMSKAAQATERPIQRAVRRPVRLAMAGFAAALLVLAAAGVVWLTRGKSSADNLLANLVASVGEARVVEGRLSGGFAHARLRAERGGARPPQASSDGRVWGIAAAASRIRLQAEAQPTAANLHALGLAHLAMGEIDEGIAALEKALSTGVEASLHNDLAAALIERGTRGEHSREFARALSEAEAASRIDPALPEAGFNRALALEKLGLKDAAARAWEAYLVADPTSEWSHEARARLEELRAPDTSSTWDDDQPRLVAAAASGDDAAIEALVAGHRQAAMEWTQTELLGEWGAARLRGDAYGSQRAITLARRTAPAIHELTGDASLMQALEAIRDAAQDGPRLANLAQGHAAFREGRRLYARFDVDRSSAALRQAGDAFEAGGSNFRGWAAFYAATSDYHRGRLDEASRELRRLRMEVSPEITPVLAGRILWMVGLIDAVHGRPGGSVPLFREAGRLLGRSGQQEDEAYLRFLLASALANLGDHESEWAARREGFAMLGRPQSARRMQAALMDSAAACWHQGNFDAAVSLQRESLRAGLDKPDPVTLANGYVWLARAEQRVGNEQAALGSIDQARYWMRECEDANLRSRLEAEVRAARGQMPATVGAAEAAEDLTAALGYFEQVGAVARMPELLSARARAWTADGRVAEAEADLLAAMDAVEKQRKAEPAEPLKISFFDSVGDIYDQMARLQVDSRRDPVRALEYNERGRARSLLDRLATRAGSPERPAPMTPDEMSASLAPETGLVVYAMLVDRVAAWVITPSGVRAFEVRRSPESLAQDIAEFVASLGRHERVSALRVRASHLYDELVAPASDELRGLRRIVFVPDGALNNVPFAALLNTATSTYLVQDFEIAVSPSATVALTGSARRARAGRGRPKAVTVGNPRFDRTIHPDLVDLPVAEEEARRVASLYPGSILLLGAEATKARFLSALAHAEVVHFAGHGLVARETSGMARLVMASDTSDGGPGDLTSTDLDGASLADLRLVVLAGCDTAAGAASGEGVLGLARPFLAAGAGGVVVALWPVDDRSGGDLPVKVHEGWLAGADAVRALREAQVAMIAGPDIELRSPSFWGVYQLVGLGVGRETGREG